MSENFLKEGFVISNGSANKIIVIDSFSDLNLLCKYIVGLSNAFLLSDNSKSFLTIKSSLNKNDLANDLSVVIRKKIKPINVFRIDKDSLNSTQSIILVCSPLNMPATCDGNEYLLENDSLIALKDYPNLRAALWEKAILNTSENQTCLRSIAHKDIAHYLDIEKYYSLKSKSVPTDFNVVIEGLSNDGFVKNTDKKKLDITILGMLCIATSFSDIPSLSGSKIEVVKYENDSRISSTSSPLIFEKGYLFSFGEIIKSVSNIMGRKETFKSGLRIIEEEIPSLIIRELLSNAMIHQNLNPVATHILIECFPKRMEIYSPGRMSIDPKRVLDMAPMPENRHLVEVLARFGIGEGHGTGYDKIIESTEEYMLPSPIIKIEEYGTRIIVFKRKDWLDYDEEEKLSAIYNHVSMKYVNNQKASNETIRNRFGIKETNKAQISRLISKAIENGLIKKSSNSTGTRNTTYLPYWA